MTMAPGIEAASSPHGRAAAAAAVAAYYQGGTAGYPEAPTAQMHHSSVQAGVAADPNPAASAVHAGAHGPHEASFFASSAEASRYYQMHYESAASQGKLQELLYNLDLWDCNLLIRLDSWYIFHMN